MALGDLPTRSFFAFSGKVFRGGGGIKNVKLVLKTLFQDLCFTGNKTGLQPVSKPVEQILGFYGPIYTIRNVLRLAFRFKHTPAPVKGSLQQAASLPLVDSLTTCPGLCYLNVCSMQK